MVVIDKDVSPDIIDAYSSAFESIIGRENFIEISHKYLGIYHQATGDQANQFKKIATQIDPSAILWIKEWLKLSYNVEL
jgi:hypothetical protein